VKTVSTPSVYRNEEAGGLRGWAAARLHTAAADREDDGMDDAPQLPVAADWFSLTWVTARTAVITEPHIDELLQANLWYLRGRERDLLVDTGNGVAPLTPYLARLARSSRPREVVCLCTHAHVDHIGGFHEFDRRLLHPAEAGAAVRIGGLTPLVSATWPEALRVDFADSGFVLPDILVDAVPSVGFDPEAFRIVPAAPTHDVRGGDEMDLGDRGLTVVDLPGHTPGSVGLVDHEERALLSGDAIYDGGLIDTLPESDVDAYLATMERLRQLDVDVVYPGHGSPFDRATLKRLAEQYLRSRGG
jgi:glyoxylase-like metal-dependent hydrolase (beta-lactamase superfamily II)